MSFSSKFFKDKQAEDDEYMALFTEPEKKPEIKKRNLKPFILFGAFISFLIIIIGIIIYFANQTTIVQENQTEGFITQGIKLDFKPKKMVSSENGTWLTSNKSLYYIDYNSLKAKKILTLNNQIINLKNFENKIYVLSKNKIIIFNDNQTQEKEINKNNINDLLLFKNNYYLLNDTNDYIIKTDKDFKTKKKINIIARSDKIINSNNNILISFKFKKDNSLNSYSLNLNSQSRYKSLDGNMYIFTLNNNLYLSYYEQMLVLNPKSLEPVSNTLFLDFYIKYFDNNWALYQEKNKSYVSYRNNEVKDINSLNKNYERMSLDENPNLNSSYDYHYDTLYNTSLLRIRKCLSDNPCKKTVEKKGF